MVFFIIDNKQQTEYFTYVEKTSNIYKRFLTGDDAHFVKLRKALLQNDKVIEALNDKHKRIEVRVIEQIMFNYENYYKVNDTDLYVSSGIGESRINFRLFNKPSINFYRINKLGA